MNFSFPVGANAPPEKSSGLLESVTNNLSMIQSSFLDVFSEKMNKFDLYGSATMNDDSWKPDYFDDATSMIAQSFDNISNNVSSGSYQSDPTTYEVQQSNQQESTYQVLSSQIQTSATDTTIQDSYSTQASVESHETKEGAVNADIHTDAQNENQDTMSETKYEKSSSAQDIATKYEDVKKAALEAAQQAVTNLDEEQQKELMAKVLAMMAPEATETVKISSELLARVLETASDDTKTENIDLAAVLKESKVSVVLAREAMADEDGESAAVEGKNESEAGHDNEKISLFEFVGKKLEQLHDNDGDKRPVLTKAMQQELARAINEVMENKTTTSGNQISPDMTGKDGNATAIVDGNNQSQQQQKAQATEMANSVNAAQAKKNAVEHGNQQNFVFVDKTAQAADISETFGLARSAEARESTPVFQIARNIEVMVKEGKTSMKVHLHPESLGKIELQLTSTENGLSVMLMPNQSATVKLLESQLNQLRNTLAEAGIQLSDLNVNQQNASQQESGKKKSNHAAGGLYHDEPEFENDESQLVRLDSLSMMDYRV